MNGTSLTRRLVQLVAALGALGLGLLLVHPAESPQPAVAPADAILDRNAERAAATRAAVQEYFRADGDHFLEVYPTDATQYATLWPLTQTVVGLQSASLLSGQADSLNAIATFAPYWDDSASPAGYSASMRPPFGTG